MSFFDESDDDNDAGELQSSALSALCSLLSLSACVPASPRLLGPSLDLLLLRRQACFVLPRQRCGGEAAAAPEQHESKG
jgi:hypothetical protein